MKTSSCAVDNGFLFSVVKKYKDECFLEKSARSLINGKMYAVQFVKNKEYKFYIYSNNMWKIYYLYPNDKYNYHLLNSVNKFMQLESDIINHKEKPFAVFQNNKLLFKNTKKYVSAPDLPMLPFYFQKDLKKLDYSEKNSRYQYKGPPKYLVIAKFDKYCKHPSENRYCVFGCNDVKLYNKIYSNGEIVVTNTYEKINVVVVEKLVNEYKIIPRQHCMGIA